MPLPFDRETYAELLAQSQPKVIVNDYENKKEIALAKNQVIGQCDRLNKMLVGPSLFIVL